MSNLSNQYISSSYQSLLNLQGAGSGLTANLQAVQDGLGVTTPISLSTTEVLISGSLTMSGSIIPAVSGAFDVGSPSKPFRHIYAGAGSIYLDNHQILSLGDGGVGTSLFAPPSGAITFENDIILNNNSAEYGSTFTLIGTGPTDQANVNFNATDAFVQNISGSLNLSVNTLGGTTSGSLTLVAQNGGSIQLEANGNDGTGSVNLIAHSGSVNIQTYSDGNIVLQAQESGSVGINSAVTVDITSPQFNFEGQQFQVINGEINILGNNPAINLKLNMDGSGSLDGANFNGFVNTLTGTTTNLFAGTNFSTDNGNNIGFAWSTYNNDSASLISAFYGPGVGKNVSYGSNDNVVFYLDGTVTNTTPNSLIVTRDTVITGSLNVDSGSLLINKNYDTFHGAEIVNNQIDGGYYSYSSGSNNINFGTFGSGFDNELFIGTNATDGVTFSDWDNNIGNYSPWLITLPNNGSNPAPQFQRGLGVTGSLVVTGSIKSTNSFTQVRMSTTQSVTQGSDTTVNFDTIDVNNNGWFNTSTHVFTPTVSGYYEISFLVQVAAGTGSGQMNVQINKNNGTQALIVQDEVNATQNKTLQGSKIIYFNGSSDNVKITFYTSSNNGSQTIQDSNGSFFKAILL